MKDKVRVLIVDDGAFMRRSLGKLLGSEPGIEVIGEAVNGRDAVARFIELKPDVICLDIDMPEMNGITAMKHIMSIRPTPIIIISSMTDRSNIPFEALRLGIIDFFPKPSSMSGKLDEQVRHLLYMVRNSHQIRRENIRRIPMAVANGRSPIPSPCRHLLAVGGTLGSVGGLIQLLAQLPHHGEAGLSFVCRIPMHPMIVDFFLESVRILLGWETVWLEDKKPLQGGAVYFVPPKANLRFSNGDVMVEENGQSPDLDSFMETVGEEFSMNSTLVLLAGDKPEGIRGLAAARARGARCLAQDGETALFRDWSPANSEGLNLFDLNRMVVSVQEQLGLEHQSRGM